MEKIIKKDERMEDLGLAGLKIIQNPNYFCFGIDAVLLAWFAAGALKRRSKVIDLGTGTGIIPLLLYGRQPVERIDAVDIQENMVEMAKRSIMLNHLEEIIQIYQMDIRKPLPPVSETHYDVIVSNPPYMKVGGGFENPLETKAIARHELCCRIEDVALFAMRRLKDKGKLFLVHRADRFVDIVNALREKQIETKRVQFVYPYEDKPANLVLIEAVKRGKPQLKVEPPLIVYREDGCYTDSINAIYGTDGPRESRIIVQK